MPAVVGVDGDSTAIDGRTDHMLRIGRLTIPLLGLLIGMCAVGCGNRTEVSGPSPVPKQDQRQGPIAPVGDSTVVRGCDRHRTGVGYGGVTDDGLKAGLRVGPIVLLGLGELRMYQLPLPAEGGRFHAIESVAVVKAGTTMTIEVPRSQRQYVGLIYDQDKFRGDGTYRIEELDWKARFEACADRRFNHGYSQFDGGIVVAGQRCFSLIFRFDERRKAIRRRVPRKGRCAEPVEEGDAPF